MKEIYPVIEVAGAMEPAVSAVLGSQVVRILRKRRKEMHATWSFYNFDFRELVRSREQAYAWVIFAGLYKFGAQ